MKFYINAAWAIFIVAVVLPLNAEAAEITGELKQWHPIALSFEGPETSEDANPNPFLDYRLNVTFTGPGGQTYLVPGYYAADGDAVNTGATSGKIWRARFNADQTGQWHYHASFRKGPKVNISLESEAGSTAGFCDGQTGTFQIEPSDKTGKDFRARGQLRYVGEHYLQFAGDKQWFIKSGCDSPEDFWGYADFDNTPKGPFGIHFYSVHKKHWKEGDPTWAGGKGKGIIGAFNYLSSVGINSVYALTMNLPKGDGQNVFMWVDPDDQTRFDVSKLEQWNICIQHANSVGVQLHLVLSERENDEEVFGSKMEDRRRQYLRELAARFSHNLALQWNIGEENKNTVPTRKAILTYLRAQDPYDHPQVVHNEGDREEIMFSYHLGETNFEGISHQDADWENIYPINLDWYRRSEQAGRKWIICHDECYPKTIKPDRDNDIHRQRAMWANLMAGGAGVEYIMAGLQEVDDFTLWERTWKWMHAGSEFMVNLPIELPMLKPNDGLLSGQDQYDHCLAAPGQVYLVYICDGATPTLKITDGEYIVKWFDPVYGGALQDGSIKTLLGSGVKSLGDPPDDQKEWLVYLKAKDLGRD